MLFLSPLFLWALAAASLPVIIHLINRRRHQTVQWAAMQFLLKAARQSRGKRKLRNILILTCRCLVIAGLAAAAARPVVSGLLGWGGGSVDTVVLLLDRSASMEVKIGDGLESRREALLGQVRDAMADLGNPRLVLIDSASMQPLEVASPDVLPELSAVAATDASANIPAMLNRAAEFLSDVPGNAELWLASDLQASNWLVNDEGWAKARASLQSMAKQPAVRVLSIGGEAAFNASIRLLDSRRVGSELQLQLEVTRSGKGRGSMSIPLTTNLDGAATTESLTLVEQSLVFQRSIPLPAGLERGHGWVSIPADGNERDNVAFFAFGPARDQVSLVVSPEGESATFLALAAAPPGIGGQQVKVVTPDLAAAEISPELAGVFWAAPLPAGPAAEALERFLAGGGQVMFLPPGQSAGGEFLGIQWAQPVAADSDKYFILQDWDHNDGLMRDGIGGTPIAGGRLRAIQRQLPEGDLTPLARWEDGEVALGRTIVGAGTAWFLTSLPDYTWSNLGDADVLLPAVQRMVTAGAERFDAAHQAELGPATTGRITGSNGRRIDRYHTAVEAVGDHDAGVFDLGDQLLAANRPGREDAPAIISGDELDTALDGLRYTHLDQSGQAADEPLSSDVWRAFLVAALVFLVIEALLCLPKEVPPVLIPKPSQS